MNPLPPFPPVQPMKTMIVIPSLAALPTWVSRICCVGLAAWAATVSAQEAVPFRSGSSGAFGPLNVTSNTVLDLPPDGVFHCTTVDIATGVILRFNRNAANTPVRLLATGPVQIEGTIDISGADGQIWGQGGAGGPGAFDGGNTTPRLQPGQGPGGGRSNVNEPASHATAGGNVHTNLYGDPLLLSLVGGSGGAAVNLAGANRGGGGGGGAILIASDVSIAHTGSILARGGVGAGPSHDNNGSGGAIRLVAPTVTGGGRLWTESPERWSRGIGRVRIDSLNRAGFGFDHRAIYSAGANLIAQLPVEPVLRVVHVAGQDIPDSLAPGTVRVFLPSGSSATQPVRIRAQLFRSVVPIRITLYPENRDPIEIDDFIDNTSADPTEKEFVIEFPPNTPTRVHVWTRRAP